MKKNLWLFVLMCVVVGFSVVVAIFHLRSQLVFGFDQARDAFEAYAIWHNLDFKILGPSTDIPGLFHGVLWYYFLAFAYFLGRTPENAALISLITVFISVLFAGYFTQKLFKNVRITILTVIFYVLSPLFQILSRWLSNPSLALLITPCLLISLWSFLTKPATKSALITGLMFGALVQSNFSYGLMLILLPIYIWTFRVRLQIVHFLSFSAGLFVATASFLVAEIKFGSQGITGLGQFLLKSGSNPSASTAVLGLFDRAIQGLSIIITPWPKLIILIMLIFLIISVRNKITSPDRRPLMLLFIWLFGYVIFQVFSSAVVGSAFVLAAFILPVCMLFAFLVARSNYPLLFIAIALTQIFTIFRWAQTGYSPISVQRAVFISDEKKLVDYTYEQAKGKPFIVMSITNPLYINTTWAYLYQFYGQPKYGYLPFWAGPDQAGYLGNLPQKPFGEDLRYLIIEDTSSITDFYVAKIIYEEDKVSDIIEEQSFGTFRVQKRLFHQDKKLPPLPPQLINVSQDLLK